MIRDNVDPKEIIMNQYFIEKTAIQKIWHWVDLAEKDEISGLGEVKTIMENHKRILVVNDVYLLPQKNTLAHTEIDPDAVSDFMLERAKGVHSNPVRFWWHSHVNMGHSWSGTDVETINDWNGGASEWLISMIATSDHRTASRFDVYNPTRLTFPSISCHVYEPKNVELYDFCKEEFDKKCSKPVYTQGRGNWVDFDDGYPYEVPPYNRSKGKVITLVPDKEEEKAEAFEAEIEDLFSQFFDRQPTTDEYNAICSYAVDNKRLPDETDLWAIVPEACEKLWLKEHGEEEDDEHNTIQNTPE